jgi:hypothetical protein
MFGFPVDAKWFEGCWYSSRPKAKRQRPAKKLARYAICLVLVVGSVVVASHVSVKRSAGTPAGGTVLRLM